MKVIIVGGGRTGSHLSTQLLGQGHDVRLVEYRHDVLERLHHEFDFANPATAQLHMAVQFTGADELVFNTVLHRRHLAQHAFID